MEPNKLRNAAQECSANDLVEALIDWHDKLEEWVKGSTDPRELALAIVELEDLLAHELKCLVGARKQVLKLNG